MCGIFGAIQLRSRGSALPVREYDWQASKTLQIVNRLRHRGPDDVGLWHSPDNRVALAHRRLSMTSVDDGQQPVQNRDGSITAVVNGEFYGYRKIRDQLVATGHLFQSQVDSEIVIHLYREYGLDFVNHLRGEFSFLLWDETRQRLVAVRDRFGIKPLVYHRSEQRILFASEAKAILPEISNPSWNMAAFFQAAQLQYLPPDQTLFADIKLVPPGGMLVVENNSLNLHQYWDLDYPKRNQSEREFSAAEQDQAVAGIQNRLKSAVMDRLEAEAPVCFHLSGGLDSSSALGIASRESGQQQDAFTVCFSGDDGYDELAIAQRTAQFCNARLHQVQLTDLDLVSNLLTAAAASEGLAINGHLSAKYLLNQTIRRHGFKAAITGEGADETFLGYAHLRMDWWNQSGDSYDQDKLESANQSSIGMMIPHGESLPLNGLSERLGYQPTFLQAKATMGFRNCSLLCDDVREHWANHSLTDAFSNVAEQAVASGQLTDRHPVHQSTWLWSKLALAGYILKTLGDGCEMASSIEGRLPFLDHQLFEYVRGLPLSMTLQGEIEKKVLRLAVRPYVTDEVFSRPKHPFDAPPLLLGSSPVILNFVRDQVASDLFRKQPFYQATKVNALLDRVPQMSRVERQVWDPVITMMLSTLGIQQLILKQASPAFEKPVVNPHDKQQ